MWKIHRSDTATNHLSAVGFLASKLLSENLSQLETKKQKSTSGYWTSEERKSLTQQLKSQIYSPKRWCRPKQSKNESEYRLWMNVDRLMICFFMSAHNVSQISKQLIFTPIFTPHQLIAIITHHIFWSCIWIWTTRAKKRFWNYERNIQQGNVTDFYLTPQSTLHNTPQSQRHFCLSAFYLTDNLRLKYVAQGYFSMQRPRVGPQTYSQPKLTTLGICRQSPIDVLT